MSNNKLIRVSVGKTNRDPCDLMDVARRQLDHLGPVGINAKKGQTDKLFLKQGYLDFLLPKARCDYYEARVDEHCHPAVKISVLKFRRAALGTR